MGLRKDCKEEKEEKKVGKKVQSKVKKIWLVAIRRRSNR